MLTHLEVRDEALIQKKVLLDLLATALAYKTMIPNIHLLHHYYYYYYPSLYNIQHTYYHCFSIPWWSEQQ